MSTKLKVKHVQSFLQDIDDFQFGQKQKFHLQQHITPPAVAAKLLYMIAQQQQLQTSIIADLGVGTGMLICGLLFLGAQHAIGIQIDQQYINKTKQMLQQKVEGASFQLINANIKQVNIRQKTIDVVVMNPPFGTKQQGIDVQFLNQAMKICRGNIYSMHKSSTRAFLKKYCQSKGYQFYIIQTIKFPLKKRFKNYHKKQVAFTEVDIIKLHPVKKQQQKQQIKILQAKQQKQKMDKIKENKDQKKEDLNK